MWGYFVFSGMVGCTLRQRSVPVYQRLAQCLELSKLRLLAGQGVIQRRQEILLMCQLGLDFDDALVVHRCSRNRLNRRHYGRERKTSIP